MEGTGSCCMGDHDIALHLDEAQFEAFMKALLDDVQALERMLDAGMIESGIRRIGAEQEMFIVNKNMKPAPLSKELLEKLDDPRFTTELAKFNLEANLTPWVFGGDCLRQLENELLAVVGLARQKAKSLDADILLVGILPTLEKAHLTLDYLTDAPRYHQMNDALTRFRRGEFHVAIKGIDEMNMSHDNILLEACNTSFQIHFQVSPSEFANFYNLAQVVTAPVLAAAGNSPAILGWRLWQETRIALFQHAVDTRSQVQKIRGHLPRVHFGDRWVDKSVLELFKDDIARFRLLLASKVEENSLEVLDQGGIPQLSALCLHSRTIWRWNRACYGVGKDGKPHLRIENRALPSGPTVLDEMANAAFFYGLMAKFTYFYPDIAGSMPFYDAQTNFFMAARHGLEAQFTWLDGKNYLASDLILNQLLPIARAGLLENGIVPEDASRYLDVIEARVRSGRTGSQWVLQSMQSIGEAATSPLGYRSISASMLKKQKTETPVHEWDLAEWMFSEADSGLPHKVEQVMTPEPFALEADGAIDLATHHKHWDHIRYVPVINSLGELVGLVSYHTVFKHLVDNPGVPFYVRDMMLNNPVSISPDASCWEAIQLMRKHRIGCLPVTRDEKLIGILTERDLIDFAGHLFETEENP